MNESQTHLESYNAALDAAMHEDWERATQHLLQALQAEPQSVRALNLLGKVYFHRGSKQAAKRCWRQVLASAPEDPTAHACIDALAPLPIAKWVGWGSASVGLLITLGLLIFLWRDVRGIQSQLAEFQQQPPPQVRLAPVIDPMPPQDSATDSLPEAIPTPDETPDATDQSWDNTPTRTLYAEAIQAYRRRDFLGSEQKLRAALVRSDVPADLRDNVIYWLGAGALAQERVSEAVAFFQRLLEDYPHSNKRDDAWRILARLEIE